MAGSERKAPVLLVFAGPNGSGKTTVTRSIPACGTYVNADDLKKEYALSDLEAAQQAEALRNELLSKRASFSFETVLSTERNLLFMQRARAAGHTVRCIYVLTCNPEINIARVQGRVAGGGHDVPAEKIRSRYDCALALLPRVIAACDEMILYDNSEKPRIIFRKEGSVEERYPSEYWPAKKLDSLLDG